ncbi:MAG TPA: Do family serine endopeptidase [Oleiagrimonas sp.]|nr:Do family serine endopeptidase [Oleiagrimonas sp.]
MNRMSIRLSAGLALMLVAAGAFAAQLPDFTQIVKKNASAVVHVEAKYNGDHEVRQFRTQERAPQQLPPGVPEIFRHFFGQPMPRGEMKHTSIGSGFIISSDGYILTNDHVVDHADKVTVRLKDRRVLTAKVIGTDKPYDIALLKVDAEDLPTVTLGDSSSLQPGQWVLAIGSPFDFDYTVTQGIVSAVGRNFGGQDQPDVPFIQTDVPINRGNSGGPLFNLDGQVVGINSQIYSSTGGYMGVSFSIPINIAMDAVRQLKAKGYVSRGMIGVKIQQVDAGQAKALGLTSASGALVASVKDGGPGDKAGLQQGDVILAFNGTEILNAGDLPPMVASTEPGTDVTLTVLHQGKQEKVKVKLGELPRDQDSYSSITPDHAVSNSNALGFTVENMTAEQRQGLKLKKGQGVIISNVQGRQAMEAGLRPGYVITMVGQHKVGSAKEFDALTKNVKPGDTVMLLVHDSHGNSGFITITVPKHD